MSKRYFGCRMKRVGAVSVVGLLLLSPFFYSVSAGEREVVGLTHRDDSRLSLGFCEGCYVYTRGFVYLMGDGNASISVSGVVVWNGSVVGHDRVAVILSAGVVRVDVLFGGESWSWNLKVKNESVEAFSVTEWGEVIDYVKRTPLEWMMEIVKVHGVTLFFFVLACPLMWMIVKRSKEYEIVEAV